MALHMAHNDRSQNDWPRNIQSARTGDWVDTMRKLIDLTGLKFGMLQVLQQAANNQSNQTCWEVVCDCGTSKTVAGKYLKRGTTVSCGCKRNETTHGMAGTRQYKVWAAMHQRCENQNEESYPQYGGSGIRVCPEWASFSGFWADMTEGYAPNLTIDRIDNDGDYCKGNCRWATKVQQARNTSKNRTVVYQGVAMTVAEAAEKTGINKFALRQRIINGYTGEVLFGPPMKGGRKKHA